LPFMAWFTLLDALIYSQHRAYLHLPNSENCKGFPLYLTG
jgi:hypothetical protein